MNKPLPKSQQQIENLIFSIRGKQVMLDSLLAELYNTETKRLNEQVKRNIKRFPESFMFQLSDTEWKTLQSHFATAKKFHDLRSHLATTKRRTRPYVFTEQGVAMLSSVLNNDTAINVSIQIIEAFVQIRHMLSKNSLINNRLDRIERKQFETDQKFELVFNALASKENIPHQGVFFDGQVYDAHVLASKIIRSAKQNIVLIDNYIDENTLSHLTKKHKGVKVLILSNSSGKQLALDIQKVNQQYGGFELKAFSNSHDRFLIIDNKEVYHMGASLKDLGKRWFAFSLMEAQSVESIMNRIKKLF